MASLVPRGRAMRFAEAGFAAIALVLLAKLLAAQWLTVRAQRRSDELFVSLSHRIDAVAELNAIVATLHAEVLRVMPRTRHDELVELARRATESDETFREVGRRYLSNPERSEDTQRLQDYFRMVAVTRLYFSTLERVIAVAQRGEADEARVLLYNALSPIRTRQALIAANLLRQHTNRSSSLYDMLGATRRTEARVDLGANLMVLALLLVVRRLVVGRLTHESDQGSRHLALLAERNRDLDDFAHRVAHDLKGLANPITGYASLISETPDDPDRVARYAERISRKTDELVAMVDELLRLARAGNVSLGPASLNAVVSSVLEQFEAEVTRVEATFEVSIPEAVVDIGEVPLREVVQNLVQNSLKYRSPDRPLAVSLDADIDGDLVELRVRDNGVGMSGVVVEHAHEPFFRATPERDVAGSGLGLAIVSRIATAHGGALRIESREGVGTTVSVSLPRWVAPAAP